MKHWALFLVLLTLAHSKEDINRPSYPLPSENLSETEVLFQTFIADFNKVYASLEEYYHRLEIFQENQEMFRAHNANPKSTFTMGITPFADMRPKEALHQLALKPLDLNAFSVPSEKEIKNLDYIMSLDWTALGLVPEVADTLDEDGVKYMITYAIDSAKSLKDQTLIKSNYSVQELIDCTGDLQAAIQFTVSKGLESETDYKTKQGSDGCGYDPNLASLHVKEWDILRNIGGNIVTQMEVNLQKQPLVTLMNAESGSFLYYTGGIIDEGCTSQVVVNHALLLVGYDVGDNYWKLQNSWGPKWGEHGYVRVSRGANICGLESFVLSPQLY